MDWGLESSFSKAFYIPFCADGSQIVQYGNDSRLLVNWDNSSLALNLAFHTSSQDNSSLTSSVSSLAPWSNFSDIFEGSPPSVNPTALRLFDTAISNASSSSGTISALTGASTSFAQPCPLGFAIYIGPRNCDGGFSSDLGFSSI